MIRKNICFPRKAIDKFFKFPSRQSQSLPVVNPNIAFIFRFIEISKFDKLSFYRIIIISNSSKTKSLTKI